MEWTGCYIYYYIDILRLDLRWVVGKRTDIDRLVGIYRYLGLNGTAGRRVQIGSIKVAVIRADEA